MPPAPHAESVPSGHRPGGVESSPERPVDRRLLGGILALAGALQLWTLARVHGYPIADSVEYLERARLFVDGAELDPGTVRSFAFSALLVPLVAVFGALSESAAFLAARVAQMAVCLTTIALVARLAGRVFGTRAALPAAFALAVNPVYLQWSVEPLSDAAAGLCVTLAFLALHERGGFRRGLFVGLALGAAFLMAFKSLGIIACVGGLLVLRDRWRGRAHTLGWIAAVVLALLAQATLDQAVYGRFGSSVWQYAKENFGGTISTKIYWLGQKTGSDGLQEIGLDLYNASFENINQANQDARIQTKSKMPRTWYVRHLHTHLWAWPLLLLGLVGLARACLKPRWITVVIILTVAINTWVMSDKGWKSYRLWIPLLPAIATFVGAGSAALTAPGALLTARRLAVGLLLVTSIPIGRGILLDANLGKHGGYWDAMAFVSAERERGGNAEEALAAGYHWATLFRDGGPGLAQTKLPHPLYAWPAEGEARAALREPTLAALDDLDWFVSHVQLVEQDPWIAAALAERFEVVAAFHDGPAYEDLAPILVFRRLAEDAPDDPAAKRLFTLRRDGADPGALQARIAHPRSIDLRRRFEGGVVDQLVLLGYDVEVLPGTENVAWLTLHWYAGPTNGRDYTVNLRVTDPDDRGRQVNRAPCWGAHPTSGWETGWVVSDGVPIPLDSVPGAGDGALPPLGGPNRRGDLTPLRIWLATPRYEPDETGALRPVGGLTPFHPTGARPVHKERRDGRLVSDEGWTFSHDNLVLVGGFLAPVPAALRAADDGSPVPGS